MKKRWKVNPANKELQEVLGKGLNILPLTAQLLINRGLVDCDKAFCFLKPELKNLHDPFLLKDMDRAVDRVVAALGKRQKIAVYGDYDVDGTTSTALVYLFLRELGADTSYYIPQRRNEGYGLNIEAIKKLHASGVKVIITVDCGISNCEEAAYAKSLGIDIIISDHHEVPVDLPPAFAVLNPKQSDCPFPFKGLAGVGVAFNLVIALRSRLREIGFFKGEVPNLKKYLDLVCIGTVADMVPLVDENRILVKFGLKELEAATRPGLKALMEASGLKPGRCDAGNIAFQLAPRINAAGRLTDAVKAVRLLVTEDEKEAASLADELNRENSARQRIEEEILGQAISMAGDAADKGIVLALEGWHPGVIGIVASRLADRFSKPVVMISLEGEVGKGSARGIKSFNILDGLRACAERLERFGGHKAAAGLTIKKENLEPFIGEFIRYVNSALGPDDLVPEIVLDAVVSLGEIDQRLIDEIESLQPFGVSNREPVLCITDAHIVATEVVGSRHLRFKVRQKGCARSGIGFGLAGLHPIKGQGFGIAFSPYVDEWQGGRNLKLRIKDVKAECVNFLT